MRPEYRTDNAWVLFDEIVEDITRRDDVTRVCDVGGGANPALPLDVIDAHALDYVLLDVSPEELAKAPAGYRTRVQSVLDAPQEADGQYDLILSKSVIEHFEDPVRLHSILFRMVAPGGWAVHLFPTLYALPFVL